MFLRYNELRLLMADQGAFDAPRSATGAMPARPPSRSARRRGSAPPRRRRSTSLQRAVGLPGEVPRWRAGDDRRGQGLAASPGVVEGPARYVTSLDEFDQVQDGEILVCRMTNPAWVVLFTKITGLVTEAGGAVSHPAVVARVRHPGGGRHHERGRADRHRRPRARERSTGVVEILE